MVRREFQANPTRPLLLALIVASAVAAVYAVGSASFAFTHHLENSARAWLAADVSVNRWTPSTEDDVAMLGQLEPRVRWTLVTELLGTAISRNLPDSVPVWIKAVDETKYPFYGSIRITSGVTSLASLNANTALLSPDGMVALQLRVGDGFDIQGVSFRVAGVIQDEPDRFVVPPTPVGRVILTRAGIARTGILRFGGMGLSRLLFQLPAQVNEPAFCRRLEEQFPGAEVVDIRTRTPQMGLALDWVLPFLNGLAFLLWGCASAAVALLVRLQILERLDSIAILKSLGATQGQIRRIYLLQTIVISFAGAGVGIVLGRVIEIGLLQVIAVYFQIRLPAESSAGVAVWSVLSGICCALLGSWWSLKQIRRVPPARLLRRDCAENTARKYLGLSKLPLFLRYPMQHALRRQSHVRAALAALTLAAALIAFSVLGRNELAVQVLGLGQPSAPSLMVLNLDAHQADRIVEMLRTEAHVTAPPIVLTMALLTHRRPSAKPSSAEFLPSTLPASCSDQRPPGVSILEGQWPGKQSVAIDINLATQMGVRLNDQLTFAAGRHIVTVRLTAITQVVPISRPWYGIILSCDAFAELPTFTNVAVSVEPQYLPVIRQTLSRRLPGVAIADVASVWERAERSASDATRLASAVALLAAGMGLLLQGLMIRLSEEYRRTEMGILRALGGRTRILRMLLAIEHSALGCLAGLIGGILSAVAMIIGLSYLTGRTVLAFHGWTLTALVVLTGLITALSGLLVSRTLLRGSPLELLRRG